MKNEECLNPKKTTPKNKMKKHKILTAALAAAVLGGSTAMAQLNYTTGDLILAFGKAGNATDTLVNLGSLANYQTYPASYAFDLSSVLSTYGGSLTGVKWSLFAVNDLNNGGQSGVVQGDANTVWASSTTSTRVVPGQDNTDAFLVSTFNQINTLLASVQTDGSFTGITIAGTTGAATVSSAVADGYSAQMINYSGSPGMFDGTWSYNIMKNGAGTEYLLQNDANNTGNNALLEASFTLSSGGLLSVTTVPEPTTWAMVGSGMLALLAIRRRK